MHGEQGVGVVEVAPAVLSPTPATAARLPAAPAPAAPALPGVVDVEAVADDELSGQDDDGQPVQGLGEGAVPMISRAQAACREP